MEAASCPARKAARGGDRDDAPVRGTAQPRRRRLRADVGTRAQGLCPRLLFQLGYPAGFLLHNEHSQVFSMASQWSVSFAKGECLSCTAAPRLRGIAHFCTHVASFVFFVHVFEGFAFVSPRRFIDGPPHKGAPIPPCPRHGGTFPNSGTGGHRVSERDRGRPSKEMALGQGKVIYGNGSFLYRLSTDFIHWVRGDWAAKSLLAESWPKRLL